MEEKGTHRGGSKETPGPSLNVYTVVLGYPVT